MAKESKGPARLPTPAEMQIEKERLEEKGFGLSDVLRTLALGITPNAPRLPQQAYTGATSLGGGYSKGYAGFLGLKGTISFTTLRQIAERSPMLSAIISRKQFQMTRYCRVARSRNKGEVGFRVIHKREHEEDFVKNDQIKTMCHELQEMFMKPWRVFWNDGVVIDQIEPSFSGFMSKLTEDLLVINRPCVELGLDAFRVPRAMGAIDGANVIPTFAAIKFLTKTTQGFPYQSWMSDYGQYIAGMQWLSDRWGVDITEQTQYLYIMAGRPVASFKADELILAPQFPSTDTRFAGYPRSLTERAIWVVLSEILAMQANQKYFEKGSMSEVIMAMKGNQRDEHVQELAAILQANTSGVENMFRIPLVATPNGAEDIGVVNLKQNHKDMLFDYYIQKLTNLTCAIFAMHPSEINEAPRAGDNTGMISQSSQTVQIGLAQEQGLQSHLMHLKTNLFDPIIERIHPDFELDWEFGRSEQEQVSLVTSKASITTVNERRQMLGMKPLSKDQGGDVIDNMFIQQAKQQQAMEEQQKQQQQAQQQSQEGGLGQGSDEGEQDEGAGREPEGQAAEGQDEVQGQSIQF